MPASLSLRIIRKEIDLEHSPILFSSPSGPGALKDHWDVRGGEWSVSGEWLTGKNPENRPGMIVSRGDFPGNVLIEFEARTVPPCTHDIDVMWNGCWDEAKNQRGVAYVAGLEGWWEGKVGIEKSPDYRLNVATPLFDFVPGQTYGIIAGSIDGHCFVFVDKRLTLEVTDPDPIDSSRYTKVGFEAYCSHIQVRNIKVRRAVWSPLELKYEPEFDLPSARRSK